VKALSRLTLAATVAACSSATAPQNGFTGTWRGTIVGTGIVVSTVTTQNDSAVTGRGTMVTSAGAATPITVTGTSRRPNLQLTLTNTADGGESQYSATYATSDSVAGSLDNGTGFALSLALKRQ
jgi:hypothetical protein